MHSMHAFKNISRTNMVTRVARDCKIRTICGLITPAVPTDDPTENYVRAYDYFNAAFVTRDAITSRYNSFVIILISRIISL